MHRSVIMNKKLFNFCFENNRKQFSVFRRELKSLLLPKNGSIQLKSSRQLSQLNGKTID